MDELYISQKRRNTRLKELKAQKYAVKKYSIRNQLLHPQYIEDAPIAGVGYKTGFGNTDYKRHWAILYGIKGM